MTAFDEAGTSYITGDSDELSRRREAAYRREFEARWRENAIPAAYDADRRSSGLEMAAVAGIVGNQLLDSFADYGPLEYEWVRAAVRAAPLALMKSTADSYLKDSRLLGLAGVVGVLIAREVSEKWS